MKSTRVDGDFDVVFGSCIEAAKECGFNIEQRDVSRGLINASTDTTILSWGEEVAVEINKLGKNRYEIEVESNPFSQIIDWGKSKQNEEMFITEVKEIIG